MHRHVLLRAGLSVFLAALVGSFTLAAPAKTKRKGSPTPAPETKPSPEDVADRTAFVRVWKAEFASGNPVNVELKAKNGGKSALQLEPPAEGPYFTDYAACPAGDLVLEVSSRDDPDEKNPPVPLTLAADTFSTLLLRERDGKPAVEVIDDTPTGGDPESAELTVRNFAPDLVEISVKAGDRLNARMRARSGFLNIRGLDRERCQLDTIALDTAGKESRWSTEVNFSTCRKATLLIHADPYGRIRPRVALDGQPAPSKSDPPASR